MTYQRIVPALILATVLMVGMGVNSPAQQPAKAAEVPAKILAFLKAVEPAKDDSELIKKLKERHNTGVVLLEERVKEYKKGIRDLNLVFEAARMVVGAKLDLAERAEDKINVLGQSLEVAQLIENHVQKQLSHGFGSKADVERARFARLSVEVDLLKLKGGANKK